MGKCNDGRRIGPRDGGRQQQKSDGLSHEKSVVRILHGAIIELVERGRNGFDGIESLWEGVPGSELP
jgi:hypothetical protein